MEPYNPERHYDFFYEEDEPDLCMVHDQPVDDDGLCETCRLDREIRTSLSEDSAP